MNESPLFVRTYEMLLWLIPQVQKFPRAYRFSLAEHIQRLALDFQDSLVSAGKSQGEARRQWLQRADVQLAQLRLWPPSRFTGAYIRLFSSSICFLSSTGSFALRAYSLAFLPA